MRHVITVLMENQSGALARVVGLFSQRGYNIETLNVAPTEDETLSRLTLSVRGDEKIIDSICRHLNRLVDVYKVGDLSNAEYLGRELILLKLRVADGEDRDALREQIAEYRGQLIDVDAHACVAQFAGNREEVASFIAALERDDIDILEAAGSGVVGLSADARVLAKS